MSTVADALATAVRHHRAGDLAAAERLYRQVLATDPRHADALHLLGVVASQCGRHDRAVEAIGQALRWRPDYAEAHNSLGLALRALAKLGPAEAALREAVRLKPDYAEAHNSLGIVLAEVGKADEARDRFREAVRLQPEYAQGHHNLGNALLAAGDAQEAAASFGAAVRLNPVFAEAHQGLARALADLGRLDEALAHYTEAVRLRPRFALALCNWAFALLDRGETAEAERRCRQALAIDPSHAHAYYCLSELTAAGRTTFTAAEEARVRALLARPAVAPDDEVALRFALSAHLDRQGAYAEAFAEARRANACRREMFRRGGSAFDPAAHRRLVDALIETFGPDLFRRLHGTGRPGERPVFIVGMPRSGTSLVEQILASHPQVHGAGELAALDRLTRGLPGYPRPVASLDPAAVRALADAYLGRQDGPAAARVTDKLPENFLHLGLIAVLFPNARVVHCRRDPLDTCVSCFLQKLPRVRFACDLHDIGMYYREYERLMARWRAVLPLRVCDVVYEDLVADLEGVSRRLVAFLGLPWDARCLEFHRTRRPVQTASKVQVRQPIYRSSVGRWKRYAAHLGPLLEALGDTTTKSGRDDLL